jgi:hypothetical protein
VRSTIHFEPNNHPSLARSFYFEHFNHRAISALDAPHDILVDLQCVICGFLQEDLVRYSANVGFAIGTSRRWLIGEIALGDKIATELLRRSGGDLSQGTESLKSISTGRGGFIQKQRINPERKNQ